MNYTQEEIRDAHGRVKKDLENGYKNQRGIALALECQEIIHKHLTSIMEPEEEKPEEKKKKEEEKPAEKEIELDE